MLQRLGMLGFACALLCTGCSILVDPESLVIKCETTPGMTQDDPCLADGKHCVAGVCQQCDAEREDCNGVDDDCDGKIDEGHDQDGDGFSWCGGGVPELADCVPTDPAIHPALSGVDGGLSAPGPAETCDGKDNDCDGVVDESEECASAVGCGQSGCADGLMCDLATERCIAPRPVGSGCSSDAECQDGFCMDTSDFLQSGDVADLRCATACCTDGDCASGTVCEVSESGIHACLPKEIAGRGGSTVSSKCSADSDCASGLCARGTCTERCHGEGACDDSQSCVLASARSGGPLMWMCGAAKGRGDGGDLCLSVDPTSCKSGACSAGGCSLPCGRSSDCPDTFTCGMESVSLLVPLTTVSVPICGNSTTAEQLCCTNADCPSATCKPNAWEMGYAMTCQGI